MQLSLRFQTQVYLGLFERETYPWLNRLSKGIATAIDIGAAQGEYTLYFLTKTKAAKMIAFDPDMDCVPVLRKNLELNGLGQSERLEFFTKLVGASDSEREVRLDSVAKSIRTPCFIKMDVDGAEEMILKGAQIINSLPGVRWLIETHSNELKSACERILKAAGFQTKIGPTARWRVLVPEYRPSLNHGWLAAWKSE
jgi:ribosomal protein L11 methylase PrmA